jgi:hypothetical protein
LTAAAGTAAIKLHPLACTHTSFRSPTSMLFIRLSTHMHTRPHTRMRPNAHAHKSTLLYRHTHIWQSTWVLRVQKRAKASASASKCAHPHPPGQGSRLQCRLRLPRTAAASPAASQHFSPGTRCSTRGLVGLQHGPAAICCLRTPGGEVRAMERMTGQPLAFGNCKRTGRYEV